MVSRFEFQFLSRTANCLLPKITEQTGAIVHTICQLLREQQWLLGTAESCTGGGIASRITDIPGVSDVFAGGVITYSNEMKYRLLGVSKETLANAGAVSPEVSAEMVLGLVKNYNLQVGISVTGIAGPTGGSRIKPMGLVYISTCVDGDVDTSKNFFESDRETIRNQSIATALDQLKHHLLRALKGKGK